LLIILIIFLGIIFSRQEEFGKVAGVEDGEAAAVLVCRFAELDDGAVREAGAFAEGGAF
jgi:hypothetical protein